MKKKWFSALSLFFLVTATTLATPARNVIVCFGDGMGWEHMKAGRYYLGRNLSFESMPYTNTVATACADDSITDSAAAATAIFAGHKVNKTTLGLALPPDTGFTSGQEYPNVHELMKSMNKSVGVLTTCFINDATPAGFSAHETSRDNKSQILDDFFLRARPNLLWGGGAANYYMTPARATDNGYSVVTNRAGLLALPTNSADVFSCGLFGYSTMGYEYDGMGSLPHLSEMATKALHILQNNTNGFVLMVEGGEIDLAGHLNDLPRLTGEVVEFDRTVSNVLAWAQGRSDTLVVVVSDHETGGLTNLINNGTGVYPSGNFQSSYHTATPVPCFAWGQGADKLSGAMHLTNLFDVIMGNSFTAGTNGGSTNPVTVPTNWIAYNDMSWQSGQLVYHITSYGVTGTGGQLMDYASGQMLDATVSFSGATANLTTNLVTLPPDTDADAEFAGKVTIDGYRYWSSGTLYITFSNLDAARRYRFVLHGDRGQTNYTHRWTDVQVTDVDGFVNDSSLDATILTNSLPRDTTRILAANTNGLLFRFTELQPGVDGDVVFAVTACGSTSTSAYINAFSFSALPDLPPTQTNEAEWAAYNDSVWQTGQLSNNITMFGDTGTSGALTNFGDGTAIGATVSFSGATALSSLNTVPLAEGSDAHAEFYGKVTTDAYRYWSEGTLSIAFENLDPARRYGFALYGDRGVPTYTYRWTDVTITDVDGFMNNSSAGATILTTAATDDTTRILAANTNGLLFRFTEIQPGPDGDIVFEVTARGSISTSAYVNAFSLCMLPLGTDDLDGDGMPDAWEVEQFGSTDAPDGGPAEDWDGDGLSNYGEWRAGTDPKQAGSVLAMEDINTPPGDAGNMILRWDSVSGKRYAIMHTTNIVQTWAALQTNIAATPPLNTHTVGISSGSCFWRVRVE